MFLTKKSIIYFLLFFSFILVISYLVYTFSHIYMEQKRTEYDTVYTPRWIETNVFCVESAERKRCVRTYNFSSMEDTRDLEVDNYESQNVKKPSGIDLDIDGPILVSFRNRLGDKPLFTVYN